METKLGKYILGDCMNKEDGLPSTPDNYYDLAIIDGPYGIGEDGRKSASRNKYVKQKNGSKIWVESKHKAKKWDEKQPDQSYFDQLFRVSKHQIIWGCNYIKFNQKDSSSGRIIWDKVNIGTDQSDCEIAWTSLFSSIRQVEFMWSGMMQGRSLREGRRQQGNKKLNEKRIHPTQKPVLLYKWLLKYAKPGWKLLDTHVGSASSLIAFELSGFEYQGFEKDADYYRDSCKRIEERLKQPLFEAA